MAARPEPMPPLLPVIPEYTPWLAKARGVAAADAAGVDATFAARHGVTSVPPPEPADGAGQGAAGRPEERRGTVADETA
ncbi:hypothetical protein DFW101_2087 [Solidesulfovibrio carbinoliphilus subsp. oakridgensis]|uniref:Uncharacterized protein n=1 Tax=Solidesulfovibrio carbinoliphilus subsp. oakridgensis TaxID=694327 RepID=G7Q879_9BACT|nr:hypothetical protein [Solidesulfovibrio carbinoliphilus]EHJ48093.1 hypothetical protein DFW101_2087 [Solidesulfovibrio carbinoliphilus subsp. oakridgensis]